MATSMQDQPGIIAGTDYVICRRDDGTLWGFGSNAKGQLGLGSVASVAEWTQLPLTGVAKIFNGGNNTNVQYCVFAIKNNGDLYSTGYNTTARSFLGYASANTTTFTKVNLSNVYGVTCTEYGTAFVKTDGTVYYTGHDKYIGGFTTTNYKTTITRANTSLVNIIDACPSFNSGYVCYLKNTGEWYHTYKNTNVNNATAVSGNLFLGLKTDIVKLCSSKDAGHVYCLDENGDWYGWGENTNGQLGNGNTTDQTKWVKIPITDVKQVAMGAGFTLILKNDGTVWASGLNTNKQLADETTTKRTSFVQSSCRFGPAISIQAAPTASYLRLDDNIREYVLGGD